MAVALSSTLTPREVEDLIDIRKQELLEQAGCSNVHDIHNRVFCLCPFCHQRPLLDRIVTTVPKTACRHMSKAVPLPEVCEIFGQRRYVTVDEYMALYRMHVQGNVTTVGKSLVQLEDSPDLV